MTLGYDGPQTMKTVKATLCSELTGSPAQTPERCRVPWIVYAVVPGKRASPACASASAHLVGTETESRESHWRVAYFASSIHASGVGR